MYLFIFIKGVTKARSRANQIPSKTTSSNVFGTEEPCVICYEEMHTQNSLLLHCGHTFHKEVRSYSLIRFFFGKKIVFSSHLSMRGSRGSYTEESVLYFIRRKCNVFELPLTSWSAYDKGDINVQWRDLFVMYFDIFEFPKRINSILYFIWYIVIFLINGYH